MTSDPVAKYKTRLIDELEFLYIMAQKNDASLLAGLELAITTVEETN